MSTPSSSSTSSGSKPADDELFIGELRILNNQIGLALDEAQGLIGVRRKMLQDAFEGIKNPRELMGQAIYIGEQLNLPSSIVLAWLGERLNTGDTEIQNSDGDKLGVLYHLEVFEVGDTGMWQLVEPTVMRWYRKGEQA